MSFIGKLIGKITGAQDQADAAVQAAQTQSAAADRGMAEVGQRFDAGRSDILRLLMEGQAAQGAQMGAGRNDLLGLFGGTSGQQRELLGQGTDQLLNLFGQGAGQQLQLLGQGTEEQRRQLGQVQQLMQPYVQGGAGAFGAQQALAGLGAPGAQDAAIQQIMAGPEFQAMSRQGEDAILQNASATGGLRGGNVQGALAEFRPALLANLINQQYGRLAGISGQGQGAAGFLGNAGLQTGQGIASGYGNVGNALLGAGTSVGQSLLGAGTSVGNSLLGAGTSAGQSLLGAGVTGGTNSLNANVNAGGSILSGGNNIAQMIQQLLQQQGAATAGGQLAAGSVGRQGFGDLLKIGSAITGFMKPPSPGGI